MRQAETIYGLLATDPFKNVVVTKDIRRYVSFIRNNAKNDMPIPWTSDDKSFKILAKSGKTIISVLDLAVSKTPKAMEAVEKHYGKDITTRNWNTIKRIEEKLDRGIK